jgi:hypothetical protein
LNFFSSSLILNSISSAPSQASFIPSSYNDHQILEIYNSRASPDPSLPAVAFLKKGNNYYMGLRKCEIVEDENGNFVVKSVS